jgi:hypothetical protein
MTAFTQFFGVMGLLTATLIAQPAYAGCQLSETDLESLRLSEAGSKLKIHDQSQVDALPEAKQKKICDDYAAYHRVEDQGAIFDLDTKNAMSGYYLGGDAKSEYILWDTLLKDKALFSLTTDEYRNAWEHSRQHTEKLLPELKNKNSKEQKKA